MIKTISSELILGILMLAIGGIALYMARDYVFIAAIMPQAICIILLVLGLILLVQSLKATGLASGQGDSLAVILAIVVIAAYVWLLPRLGYVISSILMFTVMSFLLGLRARPIRVLGLAFVWAVGVTAITYVIFDYALLVPLPHSSFF